MPTPTIATRIGVGARPASGRGRSWLAPLLCRSLLSHVVHEGSIASLPIGTACDDVADALDDGERGEDRDEREPAGEDEAAGVARARS